MFRVLNSKHFERWLLSLKDPMVKHRVLARIDRLKQGNFGDHKYLKEGVYELRLFFGSGYRICRDGGDIIILLVGGDKSTQQQDVALAIDLATTLREK